MTLPKPIPLYPVYSQLQNMDLSDYPQLNSFLESGPVWWKQHWLWGFNFLKYTGRNKSEHTYIRFRNETERFLLWAFLAKTETIDSYRKTDILEYADFCWRPPIHWICLVNSDRFEFRTGFYQINKAWAPFRIKQAKSDKTHEPDKKKYRPAQQTLTATFTAVIALYKYLMYEELCYGNPAQVAKKDCRYFVTDAQVKEVRRLSEEQWQYALDTATELADNKCRYERSLFLIAALKTLFLRISELSERRDWSPVMSHFWEDENGSWWLKIYGKGRKIRDTTVPTQFLSYLERYRLQRGLSALPYPGDNNCLVEKIRGQGGMTSRHLTRLVQEVFDATYEKILKMQGANKARKLKEASTHWLRHTGASMEVERGRALKDLSEDLGHASMATTDTVYVQTENKKRAESGKSRTVE